MTQCARIIEHEPPGAWTGHLVPGIVYLLLGVALSVEVGVRTAKSGVGKADVGEPGVKDDSGTRKDVVKPSASTQAIPPLFSVPLAIAIIIGTTIGILGEALFDRTAYGWWNSTAAECFRNFSGTENCAMYPVKGALLPRGHSEHEAMYGVFTIVAAISLSARAFAKHSAQSQLVLNGLDRIALVFSFITVAVMWDNHASAMAADPCWGEKSARMMEFNSKMHALLATINHCSALVSLLTVLLPRQWNAVVALASLLVWQGIWLLHFSHIAYTRQPGERWLPNPRGHYIGACRLGSDACHFSPTAATDLNLLKGHATALFGMFYVLSMAVATILALVGQAIQPWLSRRRFNCCVCAASKSHHYDNVASSP